MLLLASIGGVVVISLVALGFKAIIDKKVERGFTMSNDLIKDVQKVLGSNNNFHLYAESLKPLMALYGIDTKLQKAAFLAQLMHESGEFKYSVENLNYSAVGLSKTWPSRFANSDKTPNALALSISRKPELIANNVYANRMGNGSVESGDGWKYRGRGLIQLTGKSNYKLCSEDIGIDLVNYPDKLLEPAVAVESACWFWVYNGIGALADKNDFTDVTKRINGGTHGLAERKSYYDKLLLVL